MLKTLNRSSRFCSSLRSCGSIEVRSFNTQAKRINNNATPVTFVNPQSNAGYNLERFSFVFSPKRFYANYPPHTVVGMPALSPTMEKGVLAQWAVKQGDQVKEGTRVGSIETDKSTMDWDSLDEGYVAKFLVEPGTADIVVGSPVLILAENKDDVSKFSDFSLNSEAKKEAPAAKKEAAPQTTKEDKPAQQSAKTAGGRIFVSPIARNIANQNGVPLENVPGSGPNGRIVRVDVEGYKAPETASVPVASVQKGAEYTDIPNTTIRKVIASRLTQSKQQIPHYYLTVEFPVDKLLKIRTDLNARANGKYKISVNDFVIKAAALALRKVPEVNASWNETSIRRFHNVHINVAVNSDVGLFTPIITNTDNKGLSDIANSMKSLGEKAKTGKLSPDDLQIGTFTISNLGMFGIKSFSAVINPPQACILAVGGIEKRVVPNEGNVTEPFTVANYMSCTLSCDHRVVDGALGATWLKEFKANMEDPLSMLL